MSRFFFAYVLTCLRVLRAYVLTCQRTLHAFVLKCQGALRAYVLTCYACFRAHVPTCLVCLHAHVPTFLACSCTNVPCALTRSRAFPTLYEKYIRQAGMSLETLLWEFNSTFRHFSYQAEAINGCYDKLYTMIWFNFCLSRTLNFQSYF